MMFSACGQTENKTKSEDTTEVSQKNNPTMSNKNDLDTATLGAGCHG